MLFLRLSQKWLKFWINLSYLILSSLNCFRFIFRNLMLFSHRNPTHNFLSWTSNPISSSSSSYFSPFFVNILLCNFVWNQNLIFCCNFNHFINLRSFFPRIWGHLFNLSNNLFSCLHIIRLCLSHNSDELIYLLFSIWRRKWPSFIFSFKFQIFDTKFIAKLSDSITFFLAKIIYFICHPLFITINNDRRIDFFVSKYLISMIKTSLNFICVAE